MREEGKIAMAGIVLEQHPERARLFMQWKGMDWPVMVDSLDLLELEVVPVTLLIDEWGIVRRIVPPRADPREELERFIGRKFEAPDVPSPQPAADPRSKARALVLWGGERRLDEAIAAYGEAIEVEPEQGQTHFELGVVYRKRYDSERRRPGDFQAAVDHWSRALEIDPNNYIRRRRIQQFGPRMSKPYPFYDWVESAKKEIALNGGTPVRLPVAPRGAELAEPSREFDATSDRRPEPDPEGRILRDPGSYVRAEATLVPAVIRPGETARIHLEFEPRESRRAHWNNEAEGLLVWVDAPSGWLANERRIALRNPAVEVSDEIRHVEFEVRAPEEPTEGGMIPAYALYYVCEGLKGACLFRRQDLSIALPQVVAPEGSR